FGRDDPGGPIIADHGLAGGERAVGYRLAAALQARGCAAQPLLLLYDSVACRDPLRLHPASPLVQGLQEGMERIGVSPSIIGSGLITDFNLGDSWMFDGQGVAKHCAVAVPLGPAFEVVTEIMHGCRPASSFMTITRIEGAEVFELDGRPACELIIERLGGEAALPTLSLSLTLGAKRGDPFAPFDENAYVNRLILRADRARGSITIFEPDFTLGERVQLMSRDNQLMLDSVRRGTAAVAARVRAGPPPDFCLYINCAGRASVRSGAEQEEEEVMRSVLPECLPLLGFYSGVEIAPMADGRSRPLDWTAVLAVVRRRQS
ncbi:MAG TPA: FIST C-terminal domain-containing protein, partial [Arenibaculum sp.]|nr:FIST C-terminal domain-containing protein [Arenibaculum sp.]